MSGISIWSLLLIFVIVLLLFGTKKLRNIGGDLGGAIKNFKKCDKNRKRYQFCGCCGRFEFSQKSEKNCALKNLSNRSVYWQNHDNSTNILSKRSCRVLS